MLMEDDGTTETSISYHRVEEPIRHIEAIYALPLPVGTVHSADATGWACWASSSNIQSFVRMMLSFMIEAINDRSLGTPNICGEPVNTILRAGDVLSILDEAENYYRTGKSPQARYAKYLRGGHTGLSTFDPIVTAHLCALLKLRCEYSALYNPILQVLQANNNNNNPGRGNLNVENGNPGARQDPRDNENDELPNVGDLRFSRENSRDGFSSNERNDSETSNPGRDADHDRSRNHARDDEHDADIDISIAETSAEEDNGASNEGDDNNDDDDGPPSPTNGNANTNSNGPNNLDEQNSGFGRMFANLADDRQIPSTVPKTSTYITRFTDEHNAYAGAIVFFVIHDTLFNPGKTIAEHMDKVREYRATTGQKKKGKRAMPDFGCSGPMDMKDVGEMTYLRLCRLYANETIRCGELLEQLADPITGKSHRFHPQRICTLPRALEYLRNANAKPQLLEFEFERNIDGHTQLFFPPNSTWRIYDSAINWGTLSSTFPWTSKQDDMYLKLERLLELNTRRTSDFQERRKDPFEIIQKFAKSHETQRSSVITEMLATPLPRKKLTMREQLQFYSTKPVFINQQQVESDYKVRVLPCLEFIHQNRNLFPGLPSYFPLVYDWLENCSKSKQNYNIIEKNLRLVDEHNRPLRDAPKNDIEILLDLLFINVRSDHTPNFDYLDEFGLSIIFLFHVIPSSAGIPLHLLPTFELCTFAKYTTYRVERIMGILILMIGASVTGKSEILNQIAATSIEGTTTTEMSNSRLANNTADNFDAMIKITHDIKKAILDGECPELKSGFTEGEMNHRYLETNDEGVRVSRVVHTNFKNVLLASIDKPFVGDKGMRTRMHHSHIMKVSRRNDIPASDDDRRIATTIFNGCFHLHQLLIIMASNEEFQRILKVDISLTKLIIEKFLIYVKQRRSTVGIIEDRMRIRVRDIARVAVLSNALMLNFCFADDRPAPRPRIGFREISEILPYTHDTLQIAVYSISSFLDEICSPLAYYTMKALLMLAEFPVNDYLAKNRTMAQIVNDDCTENSVEDDETIRHISWKRIPLNNGMSADGTRNKSPVLLIDPNYVVIYGNISSISKRVADTMSKFLLPDIYFDENNIHFVIQRLLETQCQVVNYLPLSNDTATKLKEYQNQPAHGRNSLLGMGMGMGRPPEEPRQFRMKNLEVDKNEPTTTLHCIVEHKASRDLGDRLQVSTTAIEQFFLESDFIEFVKTELNCKNTKKRKLITQLYDIDANSALNFEREMVLPQDSPPATPVPVVPSTSTTTSTSSSSTSSSSRAGNSDSAMETTQSIQPAFSYNQRVFIMVEPNMDRPSVEFPFTTFSAPESDIRDQVAVFRTTLKPSCSASGTGTPSKSISISEDLDVWAHYKHCLENFISLNTADLSMKRIQKVRKRLEPTVVERQASVQTADLSVSSSQT